MDVITAHPHDRIRARSPLFLSEINSIGSSPSNSQGRAGPTPDIRAESGMVGKIVYARADLGAVEFSGRWG